MVPRCVLNRSIRRSDCCCIGVTMNVSSRKARRRFGKGTSRQRSKDSTDSTDRTRTRARTRTRTRLSVGILENVGTLREEKHQKWKGKHKPKNADAHNLDSKPSIAEPEVEIDEFSMACLNVDALQESEKMRGSEWIKIEVDTSAGKTAWPQSITYGTTIPGDSDLTFRTATGELVKRWQANANCGLRQLGKSQNSRCSSTGVQTTVVCWRMHMGGVTVLCDDQGYTKVRILQRKLMLGQEGVERFSIPTLLSCVHREQRVRHLHETKRKQD